MMTCKNINLLRKTLRWLWLWDYKTLLFFIVSGSMTDWGQDQCAIIWSITKIRQLCLRNRKHVTCFYWFWKHKWKYGRPRSDVGTQANRGGFQQLLEFSLTSTSVLSLNRNTETITCIFLVESPMKKRKQLGYFMLWPSLHLQLILVLCFYQI